MSTLQFLNFKNTTESKIRLSKYSNMINIITLTEWMSGFDRILSHRWLRNSVLIFGHNSEMIRFSDNQITNSVEMSGNIIADL